MEFILNYSGLIVLIGGLIIILLKFGRQFVREFKDLWN